MIKSVYQQIDPLILPHWLVDMVNSPLQAMVIMAIARLEWVGAEISIESIVHALALDKSRTSISRAVSELSAKGLVDNSSGLVSLRWERFAAPEGGGTIGGGLSQGHLSPGSPSKEKKEKGEKERKEKSIVPLLKTNPEFNTPEFISMWNQWVQHRKSLKAPLTDIAVQRQFIQFRRLGDPLLVMAAMDMSIINGWRGLFMDEKNMPALQAHADSLVSTPRETNDPAFRTEGGGYIPRVKK